jgi:putative MATE family efflux protein
MKQTTKASAIHDLTEGPLAKQLILFALPIMGANLLQALYTMVDLWVVGKYANAAAISAVSISGQIVYLAHSIGIGLGNGGQVLISQQVGAKQYSRLNTTIGTMLSTCILSSLVAAFISAVGCDLWLDLLHTPSEALADARLYLLVCCIGIPFTYGAGTLCAILRGAGDSKIPMIILSVAAVINIVFDVVFVAGFGWGAVGAALATSMAQIVSCIAGLYCLYQKRESFGFDFKLSSFKIERHTHAALWKLSAPLVVMNAAITLSMMVVSSFVNAYGVAASAITGIGSKLNSLISVVTSSTQTATSSMVAQNFAARKMDRVRGVNRISNLICMGFFVIIGIGVFFFPQQIIGFFTQPSETEILALATPYMRAAFVLYLSFCLMATPLGHINGVGFTTLNLIIAILDGVVGRIGLSILLGQVLGWGVTGFWWGNALAAYISVILGWGYYLFGNWKDRDLLLH